MKVLLKLYELGLITHGVVPVALWNYHRVKIFKIQALKWYMTCDFESLTQQTKAIIVSLFSFVYYCSVACLTGCIAVYTLMTSHSFCDSSLQMGLITSGWNTPKFQGSFGSQVLKNGGPKFFSGADFFSLYPFYIWALGLYVLWAVTTILSQLAWVLVLVWSQHMTSFPR